MRSSDLRVLGWVLLGVALALAFFLPVEVCYYVSGGGEGCFTTSFWSWVTHGANGSDSRMLLRLGILAVGLVAFVVCRARAQAQDDAEPNSRSQV
jgi:hypothetical protein